MEDLKWHYRHQPRRVGDIVEQQVRRWQFEPDGAREEYWPVVTISRESGSLGLDIGRRVAERLGFTFWDQEIVTEVAHRLHVEPQEVSALDEYAPRAVQVMLTALRLASEGLVEDYRDQLRYLFASIGHHGAAVVVGRGAHCIIPSTQALKIRLVAPLETRIAHYERTCRVSHDEAARQVPAGDRQRVEFVRQTFRTDLADPTAYDLVINVGTYSATRADSMVLMAYLAKFGHLPAEARESWNPEKSGTVPVAVTERPLQNSGERIAAR